MVGVLALIYVSSFIDRAIVSILAEPIKNDLLLTDFEIGILSGIAFALMYSTLAIPAARLAERVNRVTLIVGALSIWSLMTMACGAAMNFLQLAIARAGVGVGESVCNPCAHSMMGDRFAPEKRATALSFYSLGVPVGSLVGILAGAWIAEMYSWRWAFVVVGAPGLVLAVLARTTLAEPSRGQFDPPNEGEIPTFGRTLRHLTALPTFRNVVVGNTLVAGFSTAMTAFEASYLLRGPFGVTLTDVALIKAGLLAVGSISGVVLGGVLSDRLGRRSDSYRLLVPAVSCLIGAMAHFLSFMGNDLMWFVAFALVAQVCSLMFMGPSFAAVHNMCEPRMRATAIAIVFFCATFFGTGLAPVLLGSISDIAAAQIAPLEWATCQAAPAMSDSARCMHLSFEGLRVAMIVGSLGLIWPAIHYARAARTFPQDRLAPKQGEIASAV